MIFYEFFDVKSFNQDLSKSIVDELTKWNVDKVTNMQVRFSGTTSFKILCDEKWGNPKLFKIDHV